MSTSHSPDGVGSGSAGTARGLNFGMMGDVGPGNRRSAQMSLVPAYGMVRLMTVHSAALMSRRMSTPKSRRNSR
ncbi:hypothetical protein [Nonomuraea sp. NPDC050202]|uniref:hypothetical protein n=1 Tax=Nonomuraea sp. NPDC050202 TaxID=3155035 RepID=UPI0033DCEAE7